MTNTDKKNFYEMVIKKIREIPEKKIEYAVGYLDGISKSFDDAVVKLNQSGKSA